ncbi:hypothetical protein KIN20_001814 [Parelaphostrongylus tenuis]|uniref:Mitochondrial fission factor n=1 Tax=Parelaphostrongylus tenuis TaxID=148309 RepID=A0AAD5LUQ8_PARTN|nr:hypothetical protein KIN20_001814 [Parelaphostrongylus tenuis]
MEKFYRMNAVDRGPSSKSTMPQTPQVIDRSKDYGMLSKGQLRRQQSKGPLAMEHKFTFERASLTLEDISSALESATITLSNDYCSCISDVIEVCFGYMIVPEHISVAGGPVRATEYKDENVVRRERLIQSMNVPDRIVLTGGNSYKGFEAEPIELIHDHVAPERKSNIQDLPNVITLADVPYLDRGEPHEERAQSENSIAIEENPLQELKLMRRQLGRISSRLFELEAEVEKHRKREKISFSAILGIAIVLLMAMLRK